MVISIGVLAIFTPHFLNTMRMIDTTNKIAPTILSIRPHRARNGSIYLFGS